MNDFVQVMVGSQRQQQDYTFSLPLLVGTPHTFAKNLGRAFREQKFGQAS